MRIVVVSDTHVPDFATALPAKLFPALRRADLILHAGDVTAAEVLRELSDFAPVHVALGNGDRRDVLGWGARPEVVVDIDGLSIAMVHDAGTRRGRERRMRKRFPHARLVIFGHSHIPIDAEMDGQRLFNPGSPTWKRREPAPTFGTLTTSAGHVVTRIVEL